MGSPCIQLFNYNLQIKFFHYNRYTRNNVLQNSNLKQYGSGMLTNKGGICPKGNVASRQIPRE